MSSDVVAFGFFAAATHRLVPVVATVLPALIILGIFTFVQMVETSVENVVFLRRIEAIRRYDATLDPAAAAFAHLPPAGSLQSHRRRHPRLHRSLVICRLWRGWATKQNADAYERVVREQVIPGLRVWVSPNTLSRRARFCSGASASSLTRYNVSHLGVPPHRFVRNEAYDPGLN